jgi:hypothetical protein
VSCRGDEIEKSVDEVVTEAWVASDPGLLGQKVVVLSFQVAHDIAKAWACRQQISLGVASWFCLPGLVVDLVTEARSIDDRQGDRCAILFRFYL